LARQLSEAERALEAICELNHQFLRAVAIASKRGRKRLIELRRAQLYFGDKLIADEVKGLREEWMDHADQMLDDEEILTVVNEALGKRHLLSRTRGRKGTPAEVVLRLLVLKHVRNWSYDVLERELRANLVYRNFTRVGFGKMPDAKTIGRWGRALGPNVIKQIHDRKNGIAQGGKMRVDTTVVETNIHYPTAPCWATGFVC
jgi:IS5 family transposase